jgi:hypothetical protein
MLDATPPLIDLACVVHLHSTYSDGTGTVSEIARAARKSAVDVVLLTDHDTLEAKRRGEEGWYGSTLVLVGEEVSPIGRNHFLAFDIDREIDHANLSAGAICEAVAREGGFGFAAHPFSGGSKRFGGLVKPMAWQDLDHPALEGIELWSFVADNVEGLRGLGDVARFVIAPHRYTKHPPARNLREWDRLSAKRRVIALGGLDAHQFGLRLGKVCLRLMGYERSFRHLRTHLLCDTSLTGDTAADRSQIYSTLRAGRCYLAVDSLASPHGFCFWAQNGDLIAHMGSEHEHGDWTLQAQLPHPANVSLIKDGQPIAHRKSTDELSFAAGEPGVYRLEAQLWRGKQHRTWIVSNPIFLR